MLKQSLRYVAVLMLFLSIQQTIKAQDPEYSMTHMAHLQLNPAMTGLSYTPTFALQYRDQWAQFDQAYKTLSFSYDQHFDPIRSGFGLMLMADRAGDGLVNTYQVMASYSYFLPVNSEVGINFGVQGGVMQRSIRYSSLLWGDQIDPLAGVQTGNIPTQEQIGADENRTLFDLSGGLLIFTGTFFGGASFKHITYPDISIGQIEEESILPMRISLHAGNTFYMNNRGTQESYIAPSLFYANQGKFHQIKAGSMFGYGPVSLGLFGRHTISNFDALMVMLGYQTGVVGLGYSIDVSMGQPASFTGLTHEIAVKITPFEDADKAKQRNRKKGLNCPNVLR